METPMPLPSDALAGISVLDLSRNLAGPYCTMLLADLGADVIKVEAPGRGDDTRSWRPPAWNGHSATFLACNRNKRSIALDLDAEAGQEIARRLARQADVVVSSFRPGSLARRGLDDESLRPLNPGLVYCSISAFGAHGPRQDQPGYDPVLQAESGMMSLNGFPDGPPARLGVAAIDLGTALWAAVGIQAALRSREASGLGTRVEVSLYETAAWWLSYHIAGFLASGEVPRRYGSAAAFLTPYEVFTTADGDLMVTAGNDRLFGALCDALEVSELAEDPAFRHNADRVANRERLHARLEERFSTRTAAEWQSHLRQRSVPCGIVGTVQDFLADEQFDALGLLVATPHPDIPDLRLVDTPLAFGGPRDAHHRPPPLLGEHTAEILHELGLSDRQVQDLRRQGAIELSDDGA
jgi:crotonobetainyl-CoA:carnitine CoA-transferase CaiB-like acyl-CoA transferase